MSKDCYLFTLEDSSQRDEEGENTAYRFVVMLTKGGKQDASERDS